MKFESIVKNRKTSKNIMTTDHMFPFMNKDSISCNFDSRLYSKKVYLLSPPSKVEKNPFGLQDKQGNVFLASTDMIAKLETKKANQHTFPAQGYLRPSAFCKIKNTNGNEVLMSSFKGRDPGQFLYKLIENNLDKEISLYEIEELLKRPRSLHLQNPNRILLESNRADSNTVKSLLLKNTPIYHVKEIGEVWLHTKFVIDDQTVNMGFIHDPRNKGVLACSN